MATTREGEKKLRYRISYVLPLQAGNSADGGHRLGVNGLAVDSRQSILYSGGRDGVVCAWDLNLDLQKNNAASDHKASSPDPRTTNSSVANGYGSAPSNGTLNTSVAPPTKLRRKIQAHMDWVNDISLVNDNQCVVSASSDQSIKIWKPTPEPYELSIPHTLGSHADYAKVLASPGQNSTWIASGGLDRQVYVWDLSGKGQVLNIDVGQEAQNKHKASIYALTATNNILAAGSIDSIVRLWDVRSGKRITRFVGHTDVIRSILLAEDGETVMTASSDSTVKIWSLSSGRCEYTMTMHQDSVWSLHSDHPQLKVFWSSDIRGLIAKTDARGKAEWDEGSCVAICQESEAVSKITHAGGYLWAATKLSSVNRWKDVNTDDVENILPEPAVRQRGSVTTIVTRPRGISNSVTQFPSPFVDPSRHNSPIPASGQSPVELSTKNLLRLSATAAFPSYRIKDVETQTLHSSASIRRPTETFDEDLTSGVCVRSSPDYTIEGQHGLIKHTILNNKRHVLTTDTAGEVTMWDLISCLAIKSFGKRHLDDVVGEVNPQESVANWCAVDTRMGALTCVLEDNTCFEAEMYADEYQHGSDIEFKEDQRINLGKWILRYIFDGLLQEELKRDEAFRKELHDAYYPVSPNTDKRSKAPGTIKLPSPELTSWFDSSITPSSIGSLSAQRANGLRRPINTPGLAIGLATPGFAIPPTPVPGSLAPVQENGSAPQSARTSTDGKQTDYFTQPLSPNPGTTPGANHPLTSPGALTPGIPLTPSASAATPMVQNEGETGSPTLEKSGLLGKIRGMKIMPKGLKKPSTTISTPLPATEETTQEAAPPVDTRPDKDLFLYALQLLRENYKRAAADEHFTLTTTESDTSKPKDPVPTIITPSLANETPRLQLPPSMVVLLQEESRSASGIGMGLKDLWEGPVSSTSRDADKLERVAPSWLASLLLRNILPRPEVPKISFMLEPWQGLLPRVCAEQNTRLNANRMLRARKIMGYVAERIEPPGDPEEGAMKPEEYLELYCNDKLITPMMTLGTIRSYIWRTGTDILFYYKANGKKEIRNYPEATAGLGISESGMIGAGLSTSSRISGSSALSGSMAGAGSTGEAAR